MAKHILTILLCEHCNNTYAHANDYALFDLGNREVWEEDKFC